MDVRDNLLEIIKERAYVQSEIARRAGLTPMMFNTMLNKKRKLDANEFVRICNVISVSLDDVANYRKAVSNSDT